MDCGYTERCPPFLEKGQCIQKPKERVPSFHAKVLGAYRLQVLTRQGFGFFAQGCPEVMGGLGRCTGGFRSFRVVGFTVERVACLS